MTEKKYQLNRNKKFVDKAHVINLISLIGWNYNIQTWEKISTNESTQIYNGSHGL